MKKKTTAWILVLCLTLTVITSVACGSREKTSEDTVVLRICNWEEYIDEGGWDEDETIDLENGTNIIGKQDMVSDFEDWYEQTYGTKVKVEYSTFGTNEELYNQLTMGDTFDLVCPSEYMIMKLLVEGKLQPYSQDFLDSGREDNYYHNGVSPYIQQVFEQLNIEGEQLSRYAAGYMWGTLGIVYNPQKVTEEEASTWQLFLNRKFNRQVTVKDSVRDSYFAAIGILNQKKLTDQTFLNAKDYRQQLAAVMNDTSEETVSRIEQILSDIRSNAYSFETDSGKADMVTGKVVANLQWSGDAVYTLDQAEEDGYELCYAAPKEGVNLWFDGWCMLKDGIDGDVKKQQATEAFVNYISRPDNVIRNMYYIGYTSTISGGDSDLIYEYANWCYGAEDEEEDTIEYPLGYFFSGDGHEADAQYCIRTVKDQTKRQLFAQYPPQDVLDRSVVMEYFDQKENERINRMWTNIRCFDFFR